MPRIVLTKTYKHEQIEFPEGTPHPEGRRGGNSGTLHLRRNSVRDVTDAELDHIRQSHPRLFACLEILPEPSVPAPVARRLQEAITPPKLIKAKVTLPREKKPAAKKKTTTKRKKEEKPREVTQGEG